MAFYSLVDRSCPTPSHPISATSSCKCPKQELLRSTSIVYLRTLSCFFTIRSSNAFDSSYIESTSSVAILLPTFALTWPSFSKLVSTNGTEHPKPALTYQHSYHLIMATTTFLSINLAASFRLPDHCTPTSPYLRRFSSAFNSCVPTSLAFLSTSLGVFSIISWLFAQVPQIYKNYHLQSAAGLSIYFLAEWLLGDLTNLLGALLTGQATWQVVVASYYVTVDVILCYQYFWYTHVRTWRKARLVTCNEDGDQEDGTSRDVLIGISPSDENSGNEGRESGDGKVTTQALEIPSKQRKDRAPMNFGSSSSNEKAASSTCRTITRTNHSPLPMASPKALLMVSIICVALTNASPLHLREAEPPVKSSNSEFAGRVLSWTSTLLYLGSRLPQIYKNAIRRSTSGLSPTLFIAAFCGNLFYSTSLLTNPLAWDSYPPYGLHGWVGPEGSDRKTWVSLAAPFWLGAAGVLIMDATIGVQFLMFDEGLEKSMVLVRDKEGGNKWQAVNGWMRGWVPGMSPPTSPREAGGPVTRPLLGERGERNEAYGTA